MSEQISEQILRLKAEKRAVILAHYYAPPEVQALADAVGDSFYLAKLARGTDADVILLCGVSFMGESAKLLNPEKKVLMPDVMADCPMAHMVAEGEIEKMRARYEDLAVVCYINSTAELKAKSDVCVTSSNALKIVRALPNKNIFFIPDRNLGRYVAEQVPEKNIILNDGCCPIHVGIKARDVLVLKDAHPTATVLAHPECEAEVLALADYIGSTADMIRYAATRGEGEYIVCTEDGVLRQLTVDLPEGRFYFPEPRPVCEGMKRNTLDALLRALREETDEITVGEEMQARALLPLERMLELAK